ncbi:hypothetical protein, partial [Paraburkholderia domus]
RKCLHTRRGKRLANALRSENMGLRAGGTFKARRLTTVLLISGGQESSDPCYEAIDELVCREYLFNVLF